MWDSHLLPLAIQSAFVQSQLQTHQILHLHENIKNYPSYRNSIKIKPNKNEYLSLFLNVIKSFLPEFTLCSKVRIE